MKLAEINRDNDTTGMTVPAFYLPPVSFFESVLLYSGLMINCEERFKKSSCRNRCFIVGANGKLLLSIPIERGRNSRQTMKDIRILYDEPWQRIHWNSIASAYGKSSFFQYYSDRFQPFYQKPFSYLIDFNFQLLEVCMDVLKWGGTIKLKDEKHSNIKFHQFNEEQIQDRKSMRREYHQVFEEKHGFIDDLSIIDLIFNLGPDAFAYLKQ